MAGMSKLEPAERNLEYHLRNFSAYRLRLREMSQQGGYTPSTCASEEEISRLRAAADGGHWDRFMIDAAENCRHRKFFRTCKGYFGLGPRAMRPGDICCVLLGAKVPFILRPERQQYLLVGECYVHGVMRGEVVRMWQRGELETEYLEIL
jgi:hypothetical protein